MNSEHFYSEIVKIKNRLESREGKDLQAFLESLDAMCINLAFIEEQNIELGNLPLTQELMSLLEYLSSNTIPSHKLKAFGELITRLTNRLLDEVLDRIVQGSGVSPSHFMSSTPGAPPMGAPDFQGMFRPSDRGTTPGVWSRGHQQFANQSQFQYSPPEELLEKFDKQWLSKLEIKFTHLIELIPNTSPNNPPNGTCRPLTFGRVANAVRERHDVVFWVRWLNSDHAKVLHREMGFFHENPELVPLIAPLFQIMLVDLFPNDPDEEAIRDIMDHIPPIKRYVNK